MKIAFYKAKYGNKFDWLISAATFSQYSHCELVFNSGICASASPRDGGIRFKEIDVNNDHWSLFDLPDITEYQEQVIEYWFHLHEYDKYDYLGAIGSALNIDLTMDNKKFCSYACAINLNLDPIVSPGALYKNLLKTKRITKD